MDDVVVEFTPCEHDVERPPTDWCFDCTVAYVRVLETLDTRWEPSGPGMYL